MNISRVLALAQKAHLRTEMELFLAHLLACSRLDLIARSEEEVSVEHLAALQKAWIQLQNGVPVSYLTHGKEFYGHEFYVDERVLIPRPETEQLVDLVLEHADKTVLELGTGSGAIACSVKIARPELKVLATDISSDALEVANKNYVQLGVNMELIQSDLLDAVPHQSFDVLVANLPYIGTERHNAIAENVEKFEPHVALFGGGDGLDLYRRLFQQIKEESWHFKWVLGEIGFSQGPAMFELIQSFFPETELRILKDFQGLDRHFSVRRL